VDQQDEEEWRPVPSLPGVMASSWGRVHRVSHDRPGNRAGRKTRPIYGSRRRLPSGYISVTVHWTDLGLFTVSRLVLEAHVGPPFDGAIAMHKNDDSTDNRIENLKWGTHAENLSTAEVRKKHSEWKRKYWARWREERAARVAA
jgi:hypothetical protein